MLMYRSIFTLPNTNTHALTIRYSANPICIWYQLLNANAVNAQIYPTLCFKMIMLDSYKMLTPQRRWSESSYYDPRVLWVANPHFDGQNIPSTRCFCCSCLHYGMNFRQWPCCCYCRCSCRGSNFWCSRRRYCGRLETTSKPPILHA